MSPLSCYVHIGDPAYTGLFRAHDLFQAPNDPIDFQVFNLRERAAREMLLDPDTGLATQYMPPGDHVAHYVILGFGLAGQAIALEAARIAHFSGLRRLRMTIVDDFQSRSSGLGPADEAQREFLARYPAFCPNPDAFNLADHAHSQDRDKDAWSYRQYRPSRQHVHRPEPAAEYVVNAEFIDIPAEDPDLVALLFDRFTATGDTPVSPAIIACFDDDGRSFRSAYHLRELLSMEPSGACPALPIYVYLPVEEGLEELINTDPNDAFPVHAFGSQRCVASYAQITRPKVQALAGRIAAGYRDRYGGDSWSQMSQEFRLSNEDAAAHAAVKLRTKGYRWRIFSLDGNCGDVRAETLEQVFDLGTENSAAIDGPIAKMEHNRFVAERLLAGWRYEPLPDEYESLSEEEQQTLRKEMKERKCRPSLVPFDALTDEDKPKDAAQIEVLVQAFKDLDESFEVPPEAASEDTLRET